MANLLLKYRSTPSARLERWIGADRLERMSASTVGWYGSPVPLIDVPGNVSLGGDGDFVGPFQAGRFASACDAFEAAATRFRRSLGHALLLNQAVAGAGFASISDALSRASQGYSQSLNGSFQKVGPTGVTGITSSLWRVGNTPAAGSAGSAAPGGRACTSSTTGALVYNNPASGTLHLVGADIGCSVSGNTLLLYDRIFDVAKTMNSSSTEAVSGTPSRYTSTTTTAADYCGANFLFPEVGGTALAATAHNWTTCLYTNQAGTTGQTLPSVTGVASAIVDRLDVTTPQWFVPLASGDTGIKALTQMQCSALVATGAVNFVMGRALGFMAIPFLNYIFPFDWLTNRNQTPRIFDSACLALLEVNKPSTTATTYGGTIYATNAA